MADSSVQVQPPVHDEKVINIVKCFESQMENILMCSIWKPDYVDYYGSVRACALSTDSHTLTHTPTHSHTLSHTVTHTFNRGRKTILVVTLTSHMRACYNL